MTCSKTLNSANFFPSVEKINWNASLKWFDGNKKIKSSCVLEQRKFIPYSISFFIKTLFARAGKYWNVHKCKVQNCVMAWLWLHIVILYWTFWIMLLFHLDLDFAFSDVTIQPFVLFPISHCIFIKSLLSYFSLHCDINSQTTDKYQEYCETVIIWPFILIACTVYSVAIISFYMNLIMIPCDTNSKHVYTKTALKLHKL